MNTLKLALDAAVRQASAPGAVAFVGEGDRIIFHGASGHRALQPARLPATTDTIYDLASLTKVVATTTSILLLWERGKLDLDQPVSQIIPVPLFSKFTVRHLLTHTTGLASHKVWYKEIASLDEAIQRIGDSGLNSVPGATRTYSDLGFMILGKVVELTARNSLDAFARENIFAPLGMNRTAFNPPIEWRDQCAATENCAWRGQIMQGAVHDENAYAVGGVSGHAGLFSTASDLALFCRAMAAGKLLRPDTLEEMTRIGVVANYLWQVLGWKIDPWAGGSEGYLPARRAIGHTGWTGTSLWLDLDTSRFVILLSNTPHPDRNRRQNRALRQTFHREVARQLYPRTTNTHTGLDRIAWDTYDAVKGKRIALLTNHGAVDLAGRHILDVLALEPAVQVVRVFTPEHGFSGQAEAGEKVGRQRAPVPVVSLYGDQRRPDPAQLRDVDLFVVDLPDIGARYYTYMATMKECMIACTAARVPVLVLDRPNPLGGEVLEGPIAKRIGSLVCSAPIPIRHGMTLGELALFFKETQGAIGALNLAISPLDSWSRDKLAPQCGLPWVAPSPNIPDFSAALLYIGTCLFEGVNMNEGRGTDTPFQVIGAPWLDAEEIIVGMRPADHAGCSLEPVTYTPRSIPGKATSPVWLGEACRGIRIHLTDPQAARPLTLAYALLQAIHLRHPDRLEWKPFFDTLAGGEDLRFAIQSGLKVDRYLKSIEPELRAFDRRRPKRYNGDV